MAPEYDFSAGERGRYAGRFYVDPETPEGTAVVLRRAIQDHSLEAGDVGRIVGKTSDPSFQVEFSFGEETLRLTLRPGDLRLLGQHEVLHARRTRAS